MLKIVGLSHLVFTVNHEKYKNSAYLKNKFLVGDQYIFNHHRYRKDLLRDSTKKFSKINLFKSKHNDFPAFEFLESDCEVLRPSNFYGIIDKNFKQTNYISEKVQLSKNIWVKSQFCPMLNLNICNKTDLIDSQNGLWLKVYKFEEHVNFFIKSLKLKCYYQDDEKAFFRTIIVNKNLVNFDIVLFKTLERQSFFNDDIGLSTIGWITKNLVNKKEKDNFKFTESFNFKIGNRELSAQFSYDKSFLSNEYIKVNYGKY